MNLLRRSSCLALAIVLATSVSAATGAKPHVEDNAPALDPAQQTLKSLVADSQSKLALGENWQKRLFNDEVVPQYKRFLRDLQPGAAATAADVDLELIRRYIAFYGPRALHRDEKDMKGLIYVWSDRACTQCQAALPSLRRLLQRRMERRGFVPVWAPSEELGEANLEGDELEKRVLAKATEMNAAGVLVAQIRKAASDSIETSQNDMRRFQIQVLAVARADQELKDSIKRDVIGEDAILNEAGAMLTDAFLDFGARQLAIANAPQEEQGSKDEVLVDLRGFGDFASYQSFRARLESGLPGVKAVEQRRIARGQALIALRTEQSPEEIKRSLASLPAQPEVPLHVSGPTERTIRIDLDPSASAAAGAGAGQVAE